MKMRKPLIGLYCAAILLLSVAWGAADDISRLFNFTAGTTIQSSQVNQEFNQLITTMNNKMGRGVANTLSGDNVFSGATTFSGIATFSSATTPIKVDSIAERTAAAGVTIDGVLLKDNNIKVGAAGYTPAANGDFGYDSTAHQFKGYRNGSSKNFLMTGDAASTLDDLSDVTISSPSSGQALTYNGSAWVNGSSGTMVLLATATASNSTSVDFTTSINSTYDYYIIVADSIRLTTDDKGLYCRVYDATLAAWQSDASDYIYGAQFASSAAEGTHGSAGAAQIALTLPGVDGMDTTAASSGASLVMQVFKPSGTTHKKQLQWQISYDQSTFLFDIRGSARYEATTAISGVRFLPESGNISTGNFYLYGVRKSDGTVVWIAIGVFLWRRRRKNQNDLKEAFSHAA